MTGLSECCIRGLAPWNSGPVRNGDPTRSTTERRIARDGNSVGNLRQAPAPLANGRTPVSDLSTPRAKPACNGQA